MLKSSKIIFSILFLILIILVFGCIQSSVEFKSDQPAQNSTVLLERESKIPSYAIKMTPELDRNPPKSHTSEWSDPIPLSSAINTAGAEDSPFIMPDGNTLYFFFTPDVNIPVEKQLIDGVSGIYVSKKDGSVWKKPQRLILQDQGKLSLDGCEFVQGDTMWFCSVREGYVGIHWFTAELLDGKWVNWKNADFNSDYDVGELHITVDGTEVYFHSSRKGGKGDLDIWVSKKVDGKWQAPENSELEAVNSQHLEGWPFLTQDGKELWIYRDYGLWRSKKLNNKWATPELIISPLAGEASLDNEGNIYFVHHFFKDNKMIEADIYVAKRN